VRDRLGHPASLSASSIISALDGRSLDIELLIAEVSLTKHDVRPFDAGTLALCEALSERP
jgi:hypothetical protein